MGTITPLNSERFGSMASSGESLKEISGLIPDDLGAINRHIEKQLSSDVALIRQMGAYILAAGGKR